MWSAIRAIVRLVPIAVVALAIGVFFMMPSSTDRRSSPSEASVKPATVSLDDAPALPAPGAVTWAKANPVQAVLIAVVVAFAIIDGVVLARARRPGPPSTKQRMRAVDRTDQEGRRDLGPPEDSPVHSG